MALDGSPPPADPASIRGEVDRLILEVREVLDVVRGAHRALADGPDPYGPREDELRSWLGRRDEIARAIGEGIVRLLAFGEVVRLGEPEAAPVGAPARPEALAELAAGGLGPSWRPQAAPPAVASALWALLAPLDPSRRAPGRDLAELVDALLGAAAARDRLDELPPSVQRAVLGLASSLARHVQDEAEEVLGAASEEGLRSVFSSLSRWSRERRPGFVPGLSRRNAPSRGSWWREAEAWWEELADLVGQGGPERPADALRLLEAALAEHPSEGALYDALIAALDAGIHQTDARLVRLLEPHTEAVGRMPGLKTLKAALRAQGRPPAGDAAEEGAAAQIPDDWPHLQVTAGRRAAILGGDRRPKAADRIGEAFRFASVDWEVADARRVAALAERVRSGSVDLVILLRGFISHADQGVVVEACRASDVPFVVVDTGYGVAQVRRAIERYLGPDRS